MEYDITSASVCLLMINLVTLFWPLFPTSSEISCWNVSQQTQKEVWWDGAVHRG